MIIAVTGKGGCGKTALTSLIIRLLVRNSLTGFLAIDSDSAIGLAYALGIRVTKSVGNIRKEMIENPTARRIIEDRHIREVVKDLIISEKCVNLLVMGRPEGPGCYCGVNDLLKYGIESLAKEFFPVIIDCEAGPEQISRRVLSKIDFLIILTDPSFRGIEVAETIANVACDLKIEFSRIALVINKVREGNDAVIAAARQKGLRILGCIPEDREIADYDLMGRPLLELPENSPSVMAVEVILRKLTPDLLA